MIIVGFFYKEGSGCSGTLYSVIEVQVPNRKFQYTRFLKETNDLGFVMLNETTAIPLHRILSLHWENAHDSDASMS